MRVSSAVRLAAVVLAIFALSCYSSPPMNEFAEQFVRLALALGEHDADYVDAYHGPEEWREQAKMEKKSLDDILLAATELRRTLSRKAPGPDEMDKQRYRHLGKLMDALIARTQILLGRNLSFDEEAEALYDASPPVYDEEHFRGIIASLESELPGKGTVQERYERFRSAFVIPQEKLDTVFKTAIAESRRRTLQYIPLPDNETFTLEYVTGKSWSGYNWFKGNALSHIQINTDLPIYIDRAIDLGAHEGYPGHHVYNLLLEQKLLKERGWIEFCILPLFCPMGLIAEGSANYGIEVAFPREERIAFEREVLWPLAGLDARQVEQYYRIQDLVAGLSYAGNEAARGFLNNIMTRDEAIQWMINYSLMSPARAEQRLNFIKQYRSYVINYNLGKDLVRQYIESRGGTADNPQKRWEEFARLISMPMLPSDLQR